MLGLATPVLLGLYLVAKRIVFAYKRDHAAAQREAMDAARPARPALLASVSPVHAVTAGPAITMTGLALVAMYLLNTYVLYLYGE